MRNAEVHPEPTDPGVVTGRPITRFRACELELRAGRLVTVHRTDGNATLSRIYDDCPAHPGQSDCLRWYIPDPDDTQTARDLTGSWTATR